MSVGRLTPFRRFDIVLHAAAALKRSSIPVRWMIVGGGEERDTLHSLARKLSILDRIDFTGPVDERSLNEFFNRAAIVAVTSINEPFGIVPLEGMAAASAVICSDSGGPAATVQHGVTGLHFRSGDYADLARKVAYLLRNTETARQMGLEGARSALSEYTWERTTLRIGQSIAAALSSPGGHGSRTGAGKPRRAKLPRRQTTSDEMAARIMGWRGMRTRTRPGGPFGRQSTLALTPCGRDA